MYNATKIVAFTIYIIYKINIMAIVTHTFIEKSNTIIQGDSVNLGLNPILELYYGMPVSRGLIYFDIDKIKKLVEDKVYPDPSKTHHVLKMQNVGGLSPEFSCKYNKYNNSKRAVSFDLVFFLIDRHWDGGVGYDYINDGYDANFRHISTEGSNWFKATNKHCWNHQGVYNDFDIKKNIIAKQHFDIGNENIEVDVTKIVNKMINGEIENNGIGIAFDHYLEDFRTDEIQYVGFFTDHTHTFFRPYVETTYDDYINDDRRNFYLDKDNRLYFYASVGHDMVNLDELPTCCINGDYKAVKQATKGVYYIDINMSSNDTESETMFYDVWGNLKYKGRIIPDKELYFTTKDSHEYFSFGLPTETRKDDKIVPCLYGINDKEVIESGDVRKVNLIAKIAYTTRQECDCDGIYYKIYGKETDIEIPVINWMPIEKAYNDNYFLIDTKQFATGKYYIAIKIERNGEELINKEMCEFKIINRQ